MSVPLISALVCTHNREDDLKAAIDSLSQQDFYSQLGYLSAALKGMLKKQNQGWRIKYKKSSKKFFILVS